MNNHLYRVELEWKGNLGVGTKTYTSYSRDYTYEAPGKPIMEGSSDPIFRGDQNKYNPEELLVVALSSCHMLWYLHLCAVNDIIVLEYKDYPEGKMSLDETGNGSFSEVHLNPHIKINNKDKYHLAMSLHNEAHKACFIAKSVNFPVLNHPTIQF